MNERTTTTERAEVVIIGGGQAGLVTAYHLQRRGRSSVILDAHHRTGDSWRERWDSLRLFTPAALSALPGMRQPRGRWDFATKDEFADYLEDYARQYELDVRHGTRVTSLRRAGDHYVVDAGTQRFEADHVVIATGGYQEPHVPVFAPELNPGLLQMHSSAYKNPSQLKDGGVLVVGAGNSGAEIALELVGTHETWLAGSKVPAFPVRPTSKMARVVMPAFLFMATRVLTRRTPIGRRMRQRARAHAAPLIRVKPRDIAAAGVHRVGRVQGVSAGRPVLDDGSMPDVANVIWCTGFRNDYSWVDLPAFAGTDDPAQRHGVVEGEPGVYLAGQRFQHALASTFIGGVGRDADFIAKAIDKRMARSSGEAESPATAPERELTGG